MFMKTAKASRINMTSPILLFVTGFGIKLENKSTQIISRPNTSSLQIMTTFDVAKFIGLVFKAKYAMRPERNIPKCDYKGTDRIPVPKTITCAKSNLRHKKAVGHQIHSSSL